MKAPPRSIRLSLRLLALLLTTSARSQTLPASAGSPAAPPPLLTISYAGKTTAFATAEVSMLPHQDIIAFDFHEKKNHAYSGVPVRDLLARAGIQFGEKLRGQKLRLVVLVHCRDHYDIVFALAEFDDAFNSRTILLVDRQDGQPLPVGLGPVRLVVPGDKRPARWARMVTSLEVLPIGEYIKNTAQRKGRRDVHVAFLPTQRRRAASILPAPHQPTPRPPKTQSAPAYGQPPRVHPSRPA
jgi:hypothetical protein